MKEVHWVVSYLLEETDNKGKYVFSMALKHLHLLVPRYFIAQIVNGLMDDVDHSLANHFCILRQKTFNIFEAHLKVNFFMIALIIG